MKKVLILAPTYLPGVKGGGPIQSIKNLTEALNTEIDFYIITSNRDFGDKRRYSDISEDEINYVNGTKVIYTDVDRLDGNKLTSLINKISPDTLYLNSFFSYKFSILPILLKQFKKINVESIVLAPRGEFSPGALKLKKLKKQVYIKIARNLSIYKEVKWHATAKSEEKYIKEIFPFAKRIATISNFTSDYSDEIYTKNLTKIKDKVKLMFISRVHPKKNLLQALECLKGCRGEVIYDIYGPIEDDDYWEKCKLVIENLPNNISVNYKGLVDHQDVIPTFQNYHFFYFLTLGENFGHVIAESLIAGTPVIISDQTPWVDLKDKGAGWDISLENSTKVYSVLEQCISMDNDIYSQLSKTSFKFAKKELDLSEKKEGMKRLLIYD